MKKYKTTLDFEFYAESDDQARRFKTLASESMSQLNIEAPTGIMIFGFAKKNSNLLSKIFNDVKKNGIMSIAKYTVDIMKAAKNV